MTPERLRIAFATPEYVTENHFDGGLANYLDRVAQALARLGHDIHVVTLSQQNDNEFAHNGVMVHRVTLGRGWQMIDRATRYSLATTCHWLNFSTQVLRKLKQLHLQQPFDLIQYPNYSSCGVFAIPFLRAAHVVRASSYEPAWNDADGVGRSIDRTATERLQTLQYRLTKHVYAPSETLRSMLSQRARIASATVIRSPFYVETRDGDATVYNEFFKDKQYVLYFGRFQLHKGFHTLARALPRFLEQHTNAHVTLVGRDMETSLAPSMAAFARSQCGPMADRLLLLENLPHAQLYPIIAGARLIVLPSLIDNSPNACLEAMGLGGVVIGTRGTSLDELITDGANGFLVTPNDPEALAEKMISAWSDSRLPEMSVAAKSRMQDFAPEKTVASLLAYYRQVLGAASNNGHYYQ